MKRKPLSKRTRFEVFKRDSFACQYCGGKSPDILLVIDHIEPVSKGGSSDILNLITSCENCNQGKSNIPLSDKTVLSRKKAQLDKMQERREQINLMYEWQKEIINIEDEMTDKLCQFWNEYTPGFSVNEIGRAKMKKHLIRFGFEKVMRGIKTSASQYIKQGDNDTVSKSVNYAFDKIGGVCFYLDDPEAKMIFRILGIAKNRFNNVSKTAFFTIINKAKHANIPLNEIEDFTKTSDTWIEWKEGIEYLILDNGVSNESV